MSSLHCPARIFVARPATRPAADVAVDAAALAEQVRSERIALVWTSPLAPALETAEVVAEDLGVGVVVREELQERVLAGLDVLAEVADAHPGEAALVICSAVLAEGAGWQVERWDPGHV